MALADARRRSINRPAIVPGSFNETASQTFFGRIAQYFTPKSKPFSLLWHQPQICGQQCLFSSRRHTIGYQNLPLRTTSGQFQRVPEQRPADPRTISSNPQVHGHSRYQQIMCASNVTDRLSHAKERDFHVMGRPPNVRDRTTDVTDRFSYSIERPFDVIDHLSNKPDRSLHAAGRLSHVVDPPSRIVHRPSNGTERFPHGIENPSHVVDRSLRVLARSSHVADHPDKAESTVEPARKATLHADSFKDALEDFEKSFSLKEGQVEISEASRLAETAPQFHPNPTASPYRPDQKTSSSRSPEMVSPSRLYQTAPPSRPTQTASSPPPSLPGKMAPRPSQGSPPSSPSLFSTRPTTVPTKESASRPRNATSPSRSGNADSPSQSLVSPMRQSRVAPGGQYPMRADIRQTPNKSIDVASRPLASSSAKSATVGGPPAELPRPEVPLSIAGLSPLPMESATLSKESSRYLTRSTLVTENLALIDHSPFRLDLPEQKVLSFDNFDQNRYFQVLNQIPDVSFISLTYTHIHDQAQNPAVRHAENTGITSSCLSQVYQNYQKLAGEALLGRLRIDPSTVNFVLLKSGGFLPAVENKNGPRTVRIPLAEEAIQSGAIGVVYMATIGPDTSRRFAIKVPNPSGESPL